MKKIILPIVALTAAGSLAQASLIVNEQFNYTTGSLSAKAATGTGLTGNWGSAVNAGVISGNATGAVIISTLVKVQPPQRSVSNLELTRPKTPGFRLRQPPTTL